MLAWLLSGLLALGWQAAAPAAPSAPDSEVVIGVLAKRGAPIALERWTLTADYLNRSIPGRRFRILPLAFEEIPPMIKTRGIDFLFANSAIYVQSEHDFHLFRIATLVNRASKLPVDRFGGVIFTRQENRNIDSLDDLKGHTLAAVDSTSLGGYLMARLELRDRGIETERDLRIRFLGTHDAVVRAVLDRLVDAGTVRTDTLERMAATGLLDLRRIKVLQPRTHARFPFLSSTRLYPEWPMAALPHVDNDLVKAVSRALLSMSPADPAAIAGDSLGWTVPANYQPVHDLLRSLELPPYEREPPSLGDWIVSHPLVTGLATVLLAVILVSVIHLGRLNRRLSRSRGHLARAMEAQERSAVELRDNLARLKESEEKFTGLALSALDAIIMLDPQGRVVFWNRSAERTFGYAAVEAIGLDLENWLVTDTTAAPDQTLRRYLGSHEHPLSGTLLEVDARRKNGERFQTEISLSSVELKLGWHVICVLRDITRRKRLEAERQRLETELSQHHKMQALAQLADGISHEINSPMQVIGNNLRFLGESFEAIGRLLETLESLLEGMRRVPALNGTVAACEREREAIDPQYLTTEAGRAVRESLVSAEQVKRILRSMAVFADADKAVKSPVDLNKLLRDLSALSRHLWSVRAELQLDLRETELTVEAYPGELSQALLNLLVNAVQAIEERGGGISGRIRIHARREEGMACIGIEDNGTGIPAEARDHIFNPFFSTRDTGQGSGQGLTLSHDVVVRRHGGSLSFESEPGRGSCFTVRLPLPVQPPTVQPAGANLTGVSQGMAKQEAEVVATSPPAAT